MHTLFKTTIAAVLVVGLTSALSMALPGDLVADRVLGQFDFAHSGINIPTDVGLNNPAAVAIDRSVVPNRVYVVDSQNNRVMGWRSVDALRNGAPADLIIGQQDFLSSLAQCNNAAVSAETLCFPSAVAVDAAGNVYVAEPLNNRVLEYNSPFTTDAVADMVFGQNGNFTSSGCNLGGSITDATLCHPGAIAVDNAGHVYISDTFNSRILEYNAPSPANTHADTVLGQGGMFTGVCNKGGVSASSLCNPSFLAVDAAGNLYARDGGNFRVLEYNTPLTTDTTADMVFGQGGSFTSITNNCAATPSAGNLCGPGGGVAVDPSGNLYLADSFARVLEFDDPISTGHITADAVFGQPNFSSRGCDTGGVGPQSLCAPGGLAVDGANNLYVADAGNNRVLQFDNPLGTNPPKTTADLVLGQPDFSHFMPDIAKPNSLYEPMAVAVDTSIAPNRLYVADWQNHRVLGWHSVPAFSTGAAADLVIGQPDFFSGNCNQALPGYTSVPAPSTKTLCSPEGVAVDPRGNLYIADTGNSRVLEYDQPFSSGKISDLAADLVFGQLGSFTTRVSNNGGVSADSLSFPTGVATDPAGNLYVADAQNNRVLEYSRPVAPLNTSADAVFGQANSFITNVCNFGQTCNPLTCPPSPAALCNPRAVALNGAGRAFIADTGNYRITGYSAPLTTNKTADVIINLGQVTGLGFDSSGNLYAAAQQVVEYNAPLATGALPNAVIPQEAEGFCGPFSGEADAHSVCLASGVALDSGDNLYVADWPNNRVLEFDKPIPTLTPTPSPTPSPTATPTSTPTPMPPVISSIPGVIFVGGSFNVTGADFTVGSKVNFFIATARGAVNAGPWIPIARTLPTQLTVFVPSSTKLGQGFVEVQVVNTDQGFAASNLAPALLQGSADAGIPSLTSINGIGLAATSSEPAYATNNVETVVPQGKVVTLGGSGFDKVHGVAVDLFCACKGGKVGPFFINPGTADLTKAQIRFLVPSSGKNAPATGPGSFVVSNAGASKTHSVKSNAVSVPIGQKISVTSVSQSESTITVDGKGFSTLTVINFFNTQGGGAVNLGGLDSAGRPKIALALANSDQFTFTKPAAAQPGPSYVQALNPPFVLFTCSGNGPGGALDLK